MADFQGTDRYVVLRYLGSGSFGEVYEVYDRERQLKCALKLPHEATAGALYYFKREFRSLIDVTHPNLVALYELVGDQDHWFFTMELVNGVHFRDYLRVDPGGETRRSSGASGRGRTPPRAVSGQSQDSCGAATGICLAADGPPLPAGGPDPSACSPPADYHSVRILLRQLAEGLTTLHQAGKLHRDIKPSNVLITPEGHLTILDFGLVVEVQRGPVDDNLATQLIGTPAYMAPEQLEGHRGTEASDWYSVGIMLFEVLTGHQPFTGTLLEMMKGKIEGAPVAPASLVPGTPADLDALCLELLRRDPGTRPKGPEVLERLRDAPAAFQPSFVMPASLALPLLVGRDGEMSLLLDALWRVQAGQPTLVHLHGGSGTGKSLLLRHFMEELPLRAPGAVILQGRCYEQESVPYKAIDPLIDDLSRHLLHVPKERVEALVPRNVHALTRLFPVLNRNEPLTRTGSPSPDPEDAKAVRRRAILALRELLGRLCEQHPLILLIDDLHWGDLDSAYLIRELLAPPDPPPLLLVLCYRTEEATSAPVLRELLAKPTGAFSMDIPLQELSPRLAQELAIALIGPGVPDVERLAQRIAKDSGGNPFFIGELAHHTQSGLTEPGEGPENTLYGFIQQRVTSLPEETQRIVETLALAGHPLTWEVLKQASGVEGAKLPPATLLKAGRLIRTRSTWDQQTLEIYHDFVRRAVVSTMGGNRRRSGHLRLAEILETCGEAEPETLARHYILAGETRKAADYLGRAGDHAAATLAFKGAADLYRKSLDMRPIDDPAIPDLFLRLGDVLSSAGLGKEAAETYQTLASVLERSDSLRLQRRAAEEYFRSGHFEQGVKTLEPVLASIGVKLAASPFWARLSAAYYALRLRMRGLRFVPRRQEEIPPEELERVDIVWTAVQGMWTGAIMRGEDLQIRHLLLALRVGEPSRVIRGFTHQIIHESMKGNRASSEIQRFQSISLGLAEKFSNPKLLAYAFLASGIAALRLGRWATSLELFQRAEKIYKEKCVGVNYELHQVYHQQMHSLFVLGRFREMKERLPALIQDAEERGDLLAEANLKTNYSMYHFLAQDDPEGAQRHVTRALEIWSTTEFHSQHWQALILQGTIHQYTGHPEIAWKNFLAKWPALRESRLLKVQLINVSCMEHRARSAIYYAKTCTLGSRERLEVMSAARSAMRAIQRERTDYGNTAYFKLKGMEAAAEGRKSDSIDWLLKAEMAYQDCRMVLHANVMRWCRGVQLGEAGFDLVKGSEDWMRDQGIVKPDLYIRVHAPGFEYGRTSA